MQYKTKSLARFLPSLALACSVAAPAVAQCGDPNDSRPSVALVLSGGGALAASQLGALKVIEEAGVPINCVVGASMGAVLGALYASGHSPDELYGDFLDANWRSLFLGKVPYDQQSFRTKDTQRDFFSDYVIGVGSGGVTLPAAASSLRGMRQYLSERLPQGAIGGDFNRLPIPFPKRLPAITGNNSMSPASSSPAGAMAPGLSWNCSPLARKPIVSATS